MKGDDDDTDEDDDYDDEEEEEEEEEDKDDRDNDDSGDGNGDSADYIARADDKGDNINGNDNILLYMYRKKNDDHNDIDQWENMRGIYRHI